MSTRALLETVTYVMYSVSLRQRPMWHEIGPQIAGSNRWHFKESHRMNDDLQLPLTSANQMLHVRLVFTEELDSLCKAPPSRSGKNCTQEELSSLVVYVNTNPGSYITSISRLQTWQQRFDSAMPLVYVPAPGDILRHLALYVDNLKPPQEIRLSSRALVREAMSTATCTIPYKRLTDSQVDVVMRVCQSIRGLEEIINTSQGQAQLLQSLDVETVREMADFWKDEWVV